MTDRRTVCSVWAVLALTVALAVSGCSGSPAPVSTAAEANGSPLQQRLGAFSNGDATEAEQAAEDARVQEGIASCMAEEGFDYLPQSTDDPFYRPDEWRPDDAEWVAQWGYGAVDFPGQDEMLAAQDAGDANTAYFDSLTASEQTAYSLVLYGPQLTDAEIAASLDGSAPITWEQQGCWGLGYHEVRGDDPRESAEHRPLMQAISEFQASQFDAPDYAELDAEWSDCLADAGHGGFDRQADAVESIRSAAEDIYWTQTENDQDDPRLRALHDQEVELASADLACREETDYRARSLAIQYAQEERFIADHRTEFDELQADARS